LVKSVKGAPYLAVTIQNETDNEGLIVGSAKSS